MDPHPIESIEDRYATELAKSCAAWQQQNAEEAKRIRDGIVASFGRVGHPAPAPDSLPGLMIEAAVADAIRAKNNWPTVRAWVSNRVKGKRPPTLARQVQHDPKSLAAGDR